MRRDDWEGEAKPTVPPHSWLNCMRDGVGVGGGNGSRDGGGEQQFN